MSFIFLGLNRCRRTLPRSFNNYRLVSTEEHSSHAIRNRFLDFFVQKHGHKFIRSSPVVPFCDPSVAFVNAGMNQFKGVLLGTLEPPAKRVANSQKCIRVGGKHNDLDMVGNDSYHHTFFEMLGNWSFGHYFKKDACELAWDLLTRVYRISPSRLYVTYFGGNPGMKLEPDLETRDIWLNIGVSQDRVIPFGEADNFWEMGDCGPCGPCTEIHIDHLPDRKLAVDRVNRGHSDLTELWNIVFVQYNRLPDGSLMELPTKHIDTGMGFERLLAILNGKHSNYDTDLFMPLFKSIEQVSGAKPYAGLFGSADTYGRDTAYRILADHARMITVALSDGMFPDNNHKLRRILRKALFVSSQSFHVETGLLSELANHVAESLAPTYPEIGNKLEQVKLVLKHEERLLAEVTRGSIVAWGKLVKETPRLSELDPRESAGLAQGYKELVDGSKSNNGVLSPELAFRLYDTYGLDSSIIAHLAEIGNISYEPSHLVERLSQLKRQSRRKNSSHSSNDPIVATLRSLNVPPTNVDSKYVYRKHLHYVFPELECRILALVQGGKLVSKVQGFLKGMKIPVGDHSETEKSPGHTKEGSKMKEGRVECGVLLNRSQFYSEAGGQETDRGWLRCDSGADFKIEGTQNLGGYLFHTGYIEDGNLHVGDMAALELDFEHRLGNMRHHTATHLINAALKQVLTVTTQKSSKVTTNGLTLEFAVYEEGFSLENVAQVETIVNEIIAAKVEVKHSLISSSQLLAMEGVTLMPGETYPEHDIRMVEVVTDKIVSREPCCGTHVLNTSDLEELCILSSKTVGSGSRSLKAITGPQARQVHRTGRKTRNKVKQMAHKVDTFLDPDDEESLGGEALGVRLVQLRKDLTEHNNLLPFTIRTHCLAELDLLIQRLKEGARSNLRLSLEAEMAGALDGNSEGYLVHLLRSSSSIDSVPLQKATRMCDSKPCLLFAVNESVVKVRCCVPQDYATDSFTAEAWVKKVMEVLKSTGSPPKGQNPKHVYNMKATKIPRSELDRLIEEAMERARGFAKLHLK